MKIANFEPYFCNQCGNIVYILSYDDTEICDCGFECRHIS